MTSSASTDPDLRPFAALIGAWTTEATHPQLDAVVPGGVVFEWLEGDRYVVGRSRNEHHLFPDSLWVIGAPETGGGLVMEYFDSRGVRRTYGVAIDGGGVLRLWRDDPAFAQRFAATLGREGFDGLWQVSRSGGAWEDDLRIVYRAA